MDINSVAEDSSESGKMKSDMKCCRRQLSSPVVIRADTARSKRGPPEENIRHVKPRTLLHPVNSSRGSSVSPSTDSNETTSKSSSKLSSCFAEENGFTNSSVEHSNELPHINKLPQWIIVHIFHQLSLTDRLKRAALVCRYWHHLTQDADLWREINLRGLAEVNDDVLTRLVCFSERVILIDITDCRKITDAGLEKALVVCKSLTKLSLVRCQQLTERTFLSIGENGKHLKELNLSCCFALDDSSLSLISAGCQSLTDVSLNQCSKITDKGISDIARSCRGLERLCVDQCTKLKDDWVEAVVDNCSCLKSLSCKECLLTAASMKMLSKLSHLTQLEVCGNPNVTDEVIMALVRGCPQLQCLNLSLCRLVTNNAVAHLAKYSRSLQTLHLVSCAINDKALELLAEHCQTLQTLDVAYCNQITVNAATLVSTRCQNLHYLGLMRCDQITNMEAEMLAEKHPKIHFSTMWLDCKRVLEKARLQGFVLPDTREFCLNHQNMNDIGS